MCAEPHAQRPHTRTDLCWSCYAGLTSCKSSCLFCSASTQHMPAASVIVLVADKRLCYHTLCESQQCIWSVNVRDTLCTNIFTTGLHAVLWGFLSTVHMWFWNLLDCYMFTFTTLKSLPQQKPSSTPRSSAYYIHLDSAITLRNLATRCI